MHDHFLFIVFTSMWTGNNHTMNQTWFRSPGSFCVLCIVSILFFNLKINYVCFGYKRFHPSLTLHVLQLSRLYADFSDNP